MLTLFVLLVLYQVKHFVADYPLQGVYMLGKFKKKGWVLPLAAHCGVHVLFTFAIVLSFTLDVQLAIYLSIFDFVVHFSMDRIKASPNLLGKYDKTNKKFWWALGLDQMVHHLTHYIIIFFIIKPL